MKNKIAMIAECKRLATTMHDSLGDTTPMANRAMRHLRHVIAECEGWAESYQEFNEV